MASYSKPQKTTIDGIARDQEGRPSLLELARLSEGLQQLGMLVFSGTVISLILAIVGRFVPERSRMIVYVANVVFSTSSLIGAFIYETLRKRGDALFEWISDLAQMNLLSEETPDRIAMEGAKPDVSAILASYARASDLPLVPGRFGPTAYAALNVLLLLMPRF